MNLLKPNANFDLLVIHNHSNSVIKEKPNLLRMEAEQAAVTVDAYNALLVGSDHTNSLIQGTILPKENSAMEQLLSCIDREQWSWGEFGDMVGEGNFVVRQVQHGIELEPLRINGYVNLTNISAFTKAVLKAFKMSNLLTFKAKNESSAEIIIAMIDANMITNIDTVAG